ncbi:MAG: helix-turn-helix transcriptional regulator [Ilumatobacteraceae bacterium]
MADRPGWTFLSNHAHVLVYLDRYPEARLRDAAAAVGVTERTVNAIVADLVAAGVVSVTKVGRRNTYRLDTSVRLRHPLEAHTTVGELLRALS